MGIDAHELLRTFQQRHKNVDIEPDSNDEVILVRHPWNDPNIIFSIAPSNEMVIADLNSIQLHYKFHAIRHIDSNCIEFIFDFLPPEDETMAPLQASVWVDAGRGCRSRAARWK